MNHSRTLVIPLFLLTWACGRNERAKPASSLATLSIAGLNELNASRARLTIRPANSEERIIELAGPQFRIEESFTPGAYTFSLELFGDSALGLIASTKVEPCKDVSATLNSGTNVLDIPVCNVKGIVLKPTEKADIEIKIAQIDRPLYRDYTLSCKNSLGSFAEARAQNGQMVTSSWDVKPFVFSEAKVENNEHILKASSGEGVLEVRASVDRANSTLKMVTLAYQPTTGTSKELRFAGWECEALAVPAVEPIPGGFPSWEAINQVDPEKSASAIYNGIDPVAESFGDDARCSIYLMASYVEDGATPVHLLRSSFAHNGHSHAFIKIKEDNAQSLNLSGKSLSGQDEMKLTLKQGGVLNSLTAARVRWLHADHFHNDTCERLVRRGT